MVIRKVLYLHITSYYPLDFRELKCHYRSLWGLFLFFSPKHTYAIVMFFFYIYFACLEGLAVQWYRFALKFQLQNCIYLSGGSVMAPLYTNVKKKIAVPNSHLVLKGIFTIVPYTINTNITLM